jgi:hypothetical protein
MSDSIDGLLGGEGPEVADLNFTPVTVSTGFGKAGYDPTTGNAYSRLDPRLAAFRDIFYGAANKFLPNEQQKQFAGQVSNFGTGLFNQAANLDTNALASQYYGDIQSIMEPARAQEESRLQDTLFRTGRSGAAIGMGSGYVNPEQFALLKAREQQNQGLALDSYDRARNIRNQDLQQGLGLFGSGQNLNMLPYQQAQSLFGVGTGIEALANNNLGFASSFNQQQMNAAQMQQQVKSQQNAAEYGNGGIFGGILGGLGGAIGQGLGAWATGGMSTLFSGMGGGGNVAPGISLAGMNPWGY